MFGATLGPTAARRAREEEIEYVREMDLHEKVQISECHMKTGQVHIAARWIDINKGGMTTVPITGVDWWFARSIPTRG